MAYDLPNSFKITFAFADNSFSRILATTDAVRAFGRNLRQLLQSFQTAAQCGGAAPRPRFPGLWGAFELGCDVAIAPCPRVPWRTLPAMLFWHRWDPPRKHALRSTAVLSQSLQNAQDFSSPKAVRSECEQHADLCAARYNR
jgi:hypothetical protein